MKRQEEKLPHLWRYKFGVRGHSETSQGLGRFVAGSFHGNTRMKTYHAINQDLITHQLNTYIVLSFVMSHKAADIIRLICLC